MTQEEWNEQELAKVLYQSDTNGTYPVLEYKDAFSVTEEETDAQEETAGDQDGQKEEKEDVDTNTQDAYLTLNDDSINPTTASTTRIMEDGASSQPPKIVIAKFYAHWCPHCIHYKPTYISIAKEILRRTMSISSDNIQFWAVSCGLNPRICETYDIDGYPSILGWRLGGDSEGLKMDKNGYYYGIPNTLSDRGIELNPQPDDDEGEAIEVTADTIAAMLDFDLAMDTSNAEDEEEDEELTEEEIQKYKQLQIQGGIDAANLKSTWIEYSYQSHEALKKSSMGYKVKSSTTARLDLELLNERYHDAAASFAYIMKNDIAYTRQHKQSKLQQNHHQQQQYQRQLEERKLSTLREFLGLVNWSTPRQWHGMNELVTHLIHDFDSIFTSRASTNRIIDQYLDGGDTKSKYITWGHIEPNTAAKLHQHQVAKKRTSLGVDGPLHYRRPLTKNEIRQQNSQWSDACTHSQPIHFLQKQSSKNNDESTTEKSPYRTTGFTCGLWTLLHIISVGTSNPQQILQGYHQGYAVSPKYVGETIKDFLELYFKCDVCRSNFITMYNSCGLDHCHRLSASLELPVSLDGVESQASKELALWLWEVHNAVNSRLMKENAERDRRNVTKAETLASKFPSKRMCSTCWLDEDMEIFDRDKVFEFLQKWYWPSSETMHIAYKAEVSSSYNSIKVLLLLLLVLIARKRFMKEKLVIKLA